MTEKTAQQKTGFNPIRARALIVGFLLCFPASYAVTNQGTSSIFSLMTPPVGLNLYVLKGVAPDVPLSTVLRGSMPFVLNVAKSVVLLRMPMSPPIVLR